MKKTILIIILTAIISQNIKAQVCPGFVISPGQNYAFNGNCTMISSKTAFTVAPTPGQTQTQPKGT